MRRDIPIEAVSIDGSFIEDLLPGYMTIKTAGRETLPPTIRTIKVGSADGETFKDSNYPAREITVEFLLRGNSLSDVRLKLNQLNNILTAEERDFIFNDEEDKYFTGVPHLASDISDSKNACQGKYVIYCAYPFKRSINVYEAEPTEYQDNSARFVIDYQGTYPAKPVFQAEFSAAEEEGELSGDGDCGYIAFIDPDENIIQIGNPEAVDFTEWENASTLINVGSFQSAASFTLTGTSFSGRSGSGSVTYGRISDPYYKKGVGQNTWHVKPTFGNVTTGWHGPNFRRSITASKFFTLSSVLRLARSNDSEMGAIEICAYAGNTVVAGIQIYKDKTGTTGTMRYIVDGEEKYRSSINLSYYNLNFGYTKRTQLYKTQYYNKKKKKWQDTKISGAKTRKATNGYSYTSPNGNVSIIKSAGKVTFKVGAFSKRTFLTDTETEVTSVGITFAKYKDRAALHTNAVHSIKYVANPTGEFKDIQNVFSAGDIVEADCYDASISIRQADTDEGMPAPEYGALGNDWESFSLTKGQNIITAVWSDWVDPLYKPNIKILYNEVFI